jgi:hypothetical protein
MFPGRAYIVRMTTTNVRTTAEVAADPTATYADLIGAVVRESSDDVLRAIGGIYFAPGGSLRDGNGNLREMTACEEIARPIVMAEYRRRFLAPAMEWRRCPMCGTHAKVVVGVGVCPVCDGE